MSISTPSGALIAHVVESAAGGVRRHLFDLAIGLRNARFEQAVVYSPSGADTAFRSGIAALSQRGIRFEALPMRHKVGLGDLRTVIELRRLLGRLRPDLIHLHSSKAGALGRLAAILGLGQPIVYTPHATGAHRGVLYAIAERVLGRLRTSACIAVAPSEIEDLHRFGVVANERIHQITNGIDVARVRNLAAARSVDGVDVTICGRICDQKDPRTVAAAAAAVLRERPHTTFRWVGDGDLREEFEGELAQLGVARQWEITGWVEEPYPYIAATRLLWLASKYESFGYVTLEAMALGVPVIGTAVAGTRDLIVSGETGFLVPVGDHGAIAARTLAALSPKGNRLELGARARERATAFSIDRMVADTARLYTSLLHHGHAERRGSDNRESAARAAF